MSTVNNINQNPLTKLEPLLLSSSSVKDFTFVYYDIIEIFWHFLQTHWLKQNRTRDSFRCCFWRDSNYWNVLWVYISRRQLFLKNPHANELLPTKFQTWGKNKFTTQFGHILHLSHQLIQWLVDWHHFQKSISISCPSSWKKTLKKTCIYKNQI